jgi:two-component system, LytTR family, response regulator
MLKAILVDDEKKASETLKKLLGKYCPQVEVLFDYQRVDAAVSGIKEHKPDLVFLDIELPDGSGFDLLSRFEIIDFDVIFITAYNEYAIKAFKFSAIDYLLKPVDIDELIAAVSKAQQLNTLRNAKYKTLLENVSSPTAKKISVPIRGGMAFVNIEDIIRLEADGAYTIIVEKDGKQHTSTRYLKEYESLLDNNLFFRIHASHLINLEKVKALKREDGLFVEMADGSKLEISRRRKDEFLEKLNIKE